MKTSKLIALSFFLFSLSTLSAEICCLEELAQKVRENSLELQEKMIAQRGLRRSVRRAFPQA